VNQAPVAGVLWFCCVERGIHIARVGTRRPILDVALLRLRCVVGTLLGAAAPHSTRDDPFDTSHLVLHAHEFLQRLCALVPRPGTHRVHYHGLLAPAARDRSRVVPAPQLVDDGPRDDEQEAIVLANEDDERRRRPTVRKLLWAALLQRVFGIDALRCPKCDGRMRVIATIIEAKVVKAILDALGLESAPPSVRSSRGPPEQEMVEYEW